jgi:hypothetical protein
MGCEVTIASEHYLDITTHVKDHHLEEFDHEAQ